MTRSFLPLILSITGIGAAAQSITNVTHTPNPVHSCQLVTFTIYGTFPSNNYSPVFFSFDTASYTVAFHASGSGTSPQTNFNQAINPIGPFPPGTHTITFDLYLNSTLTDSYTTTLTVIPAPTYDPGTSTYGNEICPAGPSIPLISLLDGSPDPGGQWYFITGFGPVAHGNNFVPGSDQEGFYLYLFDVQPPCTDTVSEVQIIYLPGNDPGGSNSIDICYTGAAIDLFDSLYGTPYTPGTWTAPGGASFTGIYDPDVNTPGNYIYTVPPIAPCTVGSTAVISVTEVQPGDAGDGAAIVVCESDTAFPIFSTLNGDPDTTGVWFDPFNIGYGTWNTPYNAPISYPGVYAYVVYSADCDPDTAFVTVTEEAEPCGIGMNEQMAGDGAFTIHPNPSSGAMTLDLALAAGTRVLSMEVLDARGIVVLSVPPVAGRSATIDLGGLPRGAYLFRLSTGSGRYARRFILQ